MLFDSISDYRISHQKCIQLIKPYSITMNPVPHHETTYNNFNSGDKASLENHLSPYSSIMDAMNTLAATKSEEMENGNKKEVKTYKEQEHTHKSYKHHHIPKIIFIAITCLEFSLLFGLILIQYISSQIQPSVFFISIISVLLLHLILVVITSKIKILSPAAFKRKISHKYSKKKNMAFITSIKESNAIPTVPKINQMFRERSNAKTKKLNHPTQIRQDIEKSEITLKGQPSPQNKRKASELQLVVKKNLLLVFKPIQMIVQIGLPSASLALFYTRINYSQSLLTLSIAIYMLAPASFITFCLFLRDIRKFLHPQVIDEHFITSEHQRMEDIIPPMTRISIEQLLHAKNNEIISNYSNEKQKNSNFGNITAQQGKSDIDKLEGKEGQEGQEGQYIRTQQIKKSVLKSPKSHDFRMRKQSSQQGGLRRRVDFNSNKNQYFQYPQITLSQSIIEEQCSKSMPSQKIKPNSLHFKYMRQRREAEAQILKSKRMNRQGKVKSLVEMAKIENPRIDALQFKTADRFC